MVTLLFTAIFIIGFLAITLYFWAPRAKTAEQNSLPPRGPLRGLFSEDDGVEPALLSALSEELKTEHVDLIERANAGDKTALLEAHALGNNRLYNEVLDQLAENADRAAALLALVSFLTRNCLPVNRNLAQAVVTKWKESPGRSSTSTTLHLTALADDADLYQSTIEAALDFWREGLLADVSASELRALFEGEFWLLSADTRNSGTGFVLKRTLANARRELETAMRVK